MLTIVLSYLLGAYLPAGLAFICFGVLAGLTSWVVIPYRLDDEVDYEAYGYETYAEYEFDNIMAEMFKDDVHARWEWDDTYNKKYGKPTPKHPKFWVNCSYFPNKIEWLQYNGYIEKMTVAETWNWIDAKWKYVEEQYNFEKIDWEQGTRVYRQRQQPDQDVKEAITWLQDHERIAKLEEALIERTGNPDIIKW